MLLIFWKVGQKRWKVETFSRLDSVLLLSSVNLPGGELVKNIFPRIPVYTWLKTVSRTFQDAILMGHT